MGKIQLKNIEDEFKYRKAVPIQKFKMAAVMILLEEIEDELYVIFQVRSSKLNKQPGDVCLPGGKIEEGETSFDAAIRETMEELQLSRNDFEVIGQMDYFVSPYGIIIFPYVAKANIRINNIGNAEVDHIFKVPILEFINKDPVLYKMEIGPINNENFPYHLINSKVYKFSNGVLEEYFYSWNNYCIWGITAHIIKSFIDIIK